MTDIKQVTQTKAKGKSLEISLKKKKEEKREKNSKSIKKKYKKPKKLRNKKSFFTHLICKA